MRHLNIFDDCIPKILYRYRGQHLSNRSPIRTDPRVVEDRGVDCEIGVALGSSIPVFPGARTQILLIAHPLRFTLGKITEQRVLERE